jgi:hypothetical protein
MAGFRYSTGGGWISNYHYKGVIMPFFDFLKDQKTKAPHITSSDRGILVFENTSEVIRAEGILKANGYDIRVMGPPPEIQSGCDLVIEFPVLEQLTIVRILSDAKIPPLQVVPVNSPLLKPVDLFRVKDFGQYLMVRAANMKLTIDKNSLIIVNISGGGCPDVPYLAAEMVGKSLSEAPSPREIGHTLCGYTLQFAYEEMKRLCSL